ncbi:MAG: DNA primase [Bacteroidota bacterium]
MITQKTINEIFETARIEDVVGDFVSLKKRGVNLIGLCPFHNEKTPSFTVSPSKNIYKCFGCGEGGNPVNFVMTHENFTYPEALRYLAKKYNIEIEETRTTSESEQERKLFDSLFLINKFAQEWYTDQLLNSNLGKSVGLHYFKERGFLEETIKKFGLGFAPPGGDDFVKTAKQKGYNAELLKKAGLVTQYGKDFFRNRVLFTIHNLTGKVVGFGGRILEANKKAPKYINTAESEIYNKSKILYGMYFAKKAIRQKENCLMVEGYTDVISLHQAGIENVVASSGTSLTVEQIRLVKRYTPNMTILFDGDPAGVKAALRGLDLVLEQDMNVKIVLLPEGEDPDSYLNSLGSQAFEEFISDNARDFILFKTSLLLEETKGDPIKKTALVKDIVNSIAKIPDPIKRSVYIKECALRLEVNEQVLVSSTNKLMQQALTKKKQREAFKQQNEEEGFWPTSEEPSHTDEVAPQPKKSGISDDFQEKDIIRLLVEFGDKEMEPGLSVAFYILANMEDIMEEFDNDFYKLVVKDCYQRVKEKVPLTQKYFLTHKNEKIQRLAVSVMSSPHEYSPNWEAMFGMSLQTQPTPEKNFKRDTIKSVDRFKFRKVDRLCRKNVEKMKSLQERGDVAGYMKAMKVHQKLTKLRKELGDLIGTVGAIK